MHEDAEMTNCKTHCNTDLSGIAFSVDQSEETSEARSSQEGEIGSLWSFLCPCESFTVFIILHAALKIKLWRAVFKRRVPVLSRGILRPMDRATEPNGAHKGQELENTQRKKFLVILAKPNNGLRSVEMCPDVTPKRVEKPIADMDNIPSRKTSVLFFLF